MIYSLDLQRYRNKGSKDKAGVSMAVEALCFSKKSRDKDKDKAIMGITTPG